MTDQKSSISEVQLLKSKDKISSDEIVNIDVKFSITGALRKNFNEKNWTIAYNKNDNIFKLKYGIKLYTTGLRKRILGKPIETYRRASIFWTRNPKLVNPHKEKRVWVQIAKNFEPFIMLTESKVQEALLDFNESVKFSASELGKGKHKLGAEVYVSWQKHYYTEPFSIKSHAKEIEVEITN